MLVGGIVGDYVEITGGLHGDYLEISGNISMLITVPVHPSYAFGGGLPEIDS